MIDSDNVLLLRPVGMQFGFPAPALPRPSSGHSVPPPSLVTATLCYRDRPFDQAFTAFFTSQVAPAMSQTGSENRFPAVPPTTISPRCPYAAARTSSCGSHGSRTWLASAPTAMP